MTGAYEISVFVDIDAEPKVVFDALTDPEKVKEYLFGTQLKTDWKVGSDITYSGEWQGKSYVDKGKVVEFEQDKKIVSTYWSAMSGLEDTPENYQTVTYELADNENGGTVLTLYQDNISDQESADHSKENWKGVLDKLKELCEA
jgi:uncharacterized protein YndB with AHSA1/START domain